MRIVHAAPSRFFLLLPLLAALGACESSSRLSPFSRGDQVYRPSQAQAAVPAPLTPAPAGDVESSNLPPPPGGATAALPAPATGGAFPQGMPGAPGGVGTASGAQLGGQPQPPAAGQLPPPRVATAPEPAASPSRSTLVGNWSLSEAAGGRCRITLSSSPKLDLYGAGTNGCQNKELQRVNAWELAGSEVILYEPGGGVVARLRQGGGGYNGATAKSGAPVSMSK